MHPTDNTPALEVVRDERDPLDAELALELEHRGLATITPGFVTDRRSGDERRSRRCECHDAAPGRRSTDHRPDLPLGVHVAMHEAGLCDCDLLSELDELQDAYREHEDEHQVGRL
jgi:hypothetical protein